MVFQSNAQKYKWEKRQNAAVWLNFTFETNKFRNLSNTDKHFPPPKSINNNASGIQRSGEKKTIAANVLTNHIFSLWTEFAYNLHTHQNIIYALLADFVARWRIWCIELIDFAPSMLRSPLATCMCLCLCLCMKHWTRKSEFHFISCKWKNIVLKVSHTETFRLQSMPENWCYCCLLNAMNHTKTVGKNIENLEKIFHIYIQWDAITFYWKSISVCFHKVLRFRPIFGIFANTSIATYYTYTYIFSVFSSLCSFFVLFPFSRFV